MSFAVAAGVIGYQLLQITFKINDKYPDLGVVGWTEIIGWFASGFILMRYTTNLCKKKKWSRACHVEGFAAAGLFVFFSALVYLIVEG